jgi:hypothetical protein
VDDGDETGSGRRRQYTAGDWRTDGYRGPPPWRRGFRPAYLAISLALVAILLAIFVIAGTR